MQVKIYIPHSVLQDYILNISTIEVFLPEGIKDVVTPYPATPFQSLFFYCNHPVSMRRDGKEDFELQPLITLTGPQYLRVNIKVNNHLRAIRVDFQPGGLYRMLGIPMNELFDCGFDARDFFGVKMKFIYAQLQEIANLEIGKNIVEKFLLEYVSKVKEMLPLDYAIRMLLSSDGNFSMTSIASLSCLSMKQFERKCQQRLGMNPKLYARILRFSKAYRMREIYPNISWIKIAYEAGYFDQMHMIRDFKVFAGVNPSTIEKELLSTPIRMQKDILF